MRRSNPRRTHRREGTPTPGVVLELGVSSISPKESVELLDGGDRAYPAMLSAIAHARKSVDLEVYAFSPSGVGARFVEALGRAARRRVAVRIVIDGWGSARRGRGVANSLREVGCEVRIYHRLAALRSRAITSLEATSRLRRWMLDPMGRLVARFADAISRVIASRKLRRASTDYSVSAAASDPGSGGGNPVARDPP